MTTSWLLTAASLAAVLLSGLMAGVFWSFSVAVMPGLARAPAAGAAVSMQEINRAILNPAFFAVFLGAAGISLFWLAWAIIAWDARWAWAGAAGLVYLAAAFGVTVFINVPLNNALDRLDASDPSQAAWMADYIRDWTRWNHVRSAGSTAALLLFALGLLR